MNQDTLTTLFLLISITSIIVLFKTFKTNDFMEKIFFCIMIYGMFIFPVLCVFFGALSSAIK